MQGCLNRTDRVESRRSFIGGSDARIIMGYDEAALFRLWQEKRGEAEAEDLSGNLVAQLGVATEGLNRRWYEGNAGETITDVQRQAGVPRCAGWRATLDGRLGVERCDFREPSSCCHGPSPRRPPLSQVHAAAAAQHVGGGGTIGCAFNHYRRGQVGRDQDARGSPVPAPRRLVVTAERKFWRSVENGEPPTLFGVDPPKPRIEAVRIVDMSASNAWVESSALFARTQAGLSRPRAGQGGIEEPSTGRRAASYRPWAAREALEGRAPSTFELLKSGDGNAAV